MAERTLHLGMDVHKESVMVLPERAGEPSEVRRPPNEPRKLRRLPREVKQLRREGEILN